ncbi:MAG: hypothetical protein Q8S13_09950, partial [Dehalococcoidia bacterium]|nr:hypothetical protein [Dehalococcoidia bacterium]
ALGTGAGEGSAVSFCEAAAEQAEQVFAYEKAARLWGLAVTCSRRLPVEQRAGLWSRLGRALWAAREWTGAVEAWEQAVRLLERLDDRPGLAKHSLALADTYRWRNELADSERWVKRALDLGLEDRAERARALSILGHIHCSRDQSDLGLSLLEEARDEVAAEGGDPFVSYWLSYGYLTSGDPDRAYAAARQGLAEASGQGHAGAVVLLAGSLIQQELCRLRPDAAREYSKVLDDAVLPTDTPGLNRSYLCKALVLGYGGRWKQVIGLCDRWMAEMRLAGRFQVAIARLVRAEASAALGNAELAQAELLRILADLSEMRPLGALHLARVLVRQGKKEEASLLIRQYVDRVTAGSRHSSPRAFLSEVAASLGKRDLCEQYYRLLSQETRPVLAVYAPISVQRVLGKLATALKDWPAAVQHFDNAVDQLTKGKAPWELAQTYLDYAAMWRARRRRGDSTRAASLEIEA